MATPGTLFPRTYIVERVEARMASIRSRRGAAKKMVGPIHRSHAKAILAYAKTLDARQAALARLTHDLLNALNEKGHDPVAVLREYERAASSVPEAKKPETYRFRDDGKPTFRTESWLRDSMPEDVRLAVEAYELEQKAEPEYEALEHSLAYLKGTPVDAFSLTSLKQLGLIDAVKFDLGAVEAEKKGRR